MGEVGTSAYNCRSQGKTCVGFHLLREKEISRRKEMGRAPCCDKANVKKGPWSPEEDSKLKQHIETYGTGGNWISLPQKAGRLPV